MSSPRLAPLYVAAASFALAVAMPSGDPDAYWHLASGRWMVEHGAVLRSDVFSSTVAGQAYSVGEWLGEIVLYLSYLAGSWAGLVLLRALLVGTAGFFLTRAAQRTGAPLALSVPIVAWALVLSSITWTDRPQLFTLALFPLLLDGLLAARQGRARLLWAVPPLLLVWTNLHGGYALGLALLVIFAADAVLARRAAPAFVAATVVAFGVTFLDPGSLGLGAAASHAASPPRFIVEEAPPDVLTAAGAVFAAFVLATLVTALLARGSLFDVLLLAPLLALGLSAQRQMPYFAFAATPFLARGAAELLGERLDRWRQRPPPRAAITGLGLGLAAAIAVSVATAPFAPDEARYPTGALAALHASAGVLLNEYDWGGFLIWRAAERPVFIDGRLFPYEPDVLRDWEDAVALRQRWRAILDHYRVTQVLLDPTKPLAVALREDGWRVLGADRGWVLLERPGRSQRVLPQR